jgi:hypothetical protein
MVDRAELDYMYCITKTHLQSQTRSLSVDDSFYFFNTPALATSTIAPNVTVETLGRASRNSLAPSARLTYDHIMSPRLV